MRLEESRSLKSMSGQNTKSCTNSQQMREAANFFLKSEQDMSMAEWNASHFFRDLVKAWKGRRNPNCGLLGMFLDFSRCRQVMEKNSWSPERLFAELGGGKDLLTVPVISSHLAVLSKGHLQKWFGARQVSDSTRKCSRKPSPSKSSRRR